MEVVWLRWHGDGITRLCKKQGRRNWGCRPGVHVHSLFSGDTGPKLALNFSYLNGSKCRAPSDFSSSHGPEKGRKDRKERMGKKFFPNHDLIAFF